MARFNNAFMNDAQDNKFQNRYNYLLDLLDQGYIVEKRINGKVSRVEISPQNGIKVSYDDQNVMYVDPLTGKIVMGAYDSALDDIGTEISGLETEISGLETAISGLGDMAYENLVEEGKLGSTIIDGGYIKSKFLTASNILTGNLYANLVNIYSSSGTSRLELVGTGLNGYLNNILRVQVEYDRLEFHRAGSSIGNIRTEYINKSWGGSILGDCLFIESAGKSIAFNAESGSTAPSLVVFPTWAEAPYFATESVNIGMLDTKQWTIDTSSTDSVFYVRETYGKGFSISTSGVFTLINSSFSRLTSWANQLDGKPYSWHIYLDGTNATLGYTNSSGVRTNYALTHSHPYAASTHSHAWADITGEPAYTTRWPSWAEVTSKPSTFPPDTHTHNTYLPLSGGTMTGNINMGSADIVGSTSGCYITAERIGLGIAANSSYTVDANTSYMRANRYVVASGTSSSYFGWNSTYGLVISRASGQDNQVLFFQNSFGELGICPTVTNKGDLGQSTSANNWYRGYATAWNNASTVDNKINITRADDSEYYELAKLMNVYLYSTDKDKQDLRFGLLTEESPAEIVGLDNNTKSGKAIDLYAFTTFNFAVIKVLQEKVEQLENELEALKDGVTKTI